LMPARVEIEPRRRPRTLHASLRPTRPAAVFPLLRASTFQVEMDQDTRRSLRARPLDPQSEPVPEDAHTVRYQCLVLREGTDPAMADPDDAVGRDFCCHSQLGVWPLDLGEEDRFARPACFVGKGR